MVPFYCQSSSMSDSVLIEKNKVALQFLLDSAAVSIFVVILVYLTNTVFVNSTNITTNIETAVLSASEDLHLTL